MRQAFEQQRKKDWKIAIAPYDIKCNRNEMYNQRKKNRLF